MRAVVKHAVYLGFAASLLAVGVPYWLIPYSQVGLPNSLMGPSLVVVLVSAAIVRIASAASFRRTVAIIGASIPAAVLIRVAVEATADPTSHNLWPIEVFIALVIGLSCSMVGAVIAFPVRKLSRSDS